MALHGAGESSSLQSSHNPVITGVSTVFVCLAPAAKFIGILSWTFLLLLAATGNGALAQTDPLPSWNNGAAKSAITDFVDRVTSQSSREFVSPEARIAVFDNDGTLWCEQPLYFQAVYALDSLAKMAPTHPEWKSKSPFKEFLHGDIKAVAIADQKSLLQLIAATHSGMSTDQFSRDVLDWVTSGAQHPRFHRPYMSLVYEPMLELLAYLRANGFKTFIVSGGGVEFMRPWTEEAYGIPPEQVVGSSGVVKLQMGADGKPELMKLPEIEFIDDGPGKPAGINRFIGRRPIFAFGNSDSDQQMLEWTAAGSGPRFAGLVHHTDDAREYAYDRKSKIGKLDKALDEAIARNWTVVDMKNDWKRIFIEKPVN